MSVQQLRLRIEPESSLHGQKLKLPLETLSNVTIVFNLLVLTSTKHPPPTSRWMPCPNLLAADILGQVEERAKITSTHPRDNKNKMGQMALVYIVIILKMKNIG